MDDQNHQRPADQPDNDPMPSGRPHAIGESGEPAPGDSPAGKLCGAKTRSGGTCRQPAMSNGRCRMHGGTSRLGIAAASYKHGRYSKYMPKALIEAAKRAMNDPELLSCKEELSIVVALLSQKLALLNKNGLSAQILASLRSVVDDIEQAQKSGDQEKAGKLIDELGQRIRRGAKAADLEAEVLDLADRKAKLAEKEHRRLLELESFISADEAMVFVNALVESVKEFIHDKVVLAAIAADIGSILGGDSATAPLAGELVRALAGQGSDTVVSPSADANSEEVSGST